MRIPAITTKPPAVPGTELRGEIGLARVYAARLLDALLRAEATAVGRRVKCDALSNWRARAADLWFEIRSEDEKES